MRHAHLQLGNESGFVLVLAIFMMALLTMIGLAAMMSSTTEVEVASSEKFSEMVSYNADTGLMVGTELIEECKGVFSFAGRVDGNDYLVGSNDFVKINDLAFCGEGRDLALPSGKFFGGGWDSGSQSEDALTLGGGGSGPGCPDPPTGSDYDYRVVDDTFCAYCDTDKADAKKLIGSGAEFGAGADGMGSSANMVVYNIDCVGNLPNNPRVMVENYMGYLYVPQ
ncbi:MAG: hypothetical protein GY868_18375 [Deltaproteobacteria bacterium]|nr:hypothetical protein [Deltaproteobacteria bacterium]